MGPIEILISYSGADEQWCQLITAALRVLQRQGLVAIWHWKMVGAGESLAAVHNAAIKRARLALILLSPSFLSDDDLREYELSLILERRRAGAMVVIPIAIRAASWDFLDGLVDVEMWPDDGIALAARPSRDVDGLIASLVDRIARMVGAMSEAEVARTAEAPHAEQLDASEVAADFFISHSKADLDFAEVLKLRLEIAGYRVWFDTDRLATGTDWRRDIDAALKAVAAVVVVVSPDARLSEYVTYEWAFATGAGIPVVPILLRQTALHPRLATIHYLDFRHVRQWSKLMAALRELKGNWTPRASARVNR